MANGTWAATGLVALGKSLYNAQARRQGFLGEASRQDRRQLRSSWA